MILAAKLVILKVYVYHALKINIKIHKISAKIVILIFVLFVMKIHLIIFANNVFIIKVIYIKINNKKIKLYI